MENMRLQKYLAICNVASRRAAEKLITEGRVYVNGNKVTELGTKVADGDSVCVDGKPITAENKKIYIMLNKPMGYVTTVKDTHAEKTVMELVGDIKERIYPVGRLDCDTSGLLFLTNDGCFTFGITHPSRKLDKVYEATVYGTVVHDGVQKLERGIYIDGIKTSPARVEVMSHRANTSVLRITIHEGRNRQIRKMCEGIGHRVQKLKRLSVGGIELGNLPLGKWRHLTESEIKKLMGDSNADNKNRK